MTPVESWARMANSWLDSGIAIAKDGTIYTGDTRGTVFAFDSSGNIKWQVSLGSGVEVRSAPVIAKDGTIYIGAHTKFAKGDNMLCKKDECLGGLLAFNPNGTLKWKVAFPKVQQGSNIILDQQGNIYVGTGSYSDSNGILYIVSPSGNVIWQYENTRSEFQTAPLLTKGGYLFAHNHYFKDRQFLEMFTMYYRTSFGSPVAGPDETVYYGTYDGSLVAIERGGSSKWKLHLNQVTTSTVSYGARISVTPALANNDLLYIGDEDGQLYSIRLSDLAEQNKYEQRTKEWENNTFEWIKAFDYYEMKELNNINEFNWIRQTDSWVSAIIVGQNGTVYVGTKEGYVYSYSPTGQLNWKMKLDGYIYDLAIDDNYTLYALSGVTLYAIGDETLTVQKNKEIVLSVGSNIAYIAGKSKTLSAAPYVRGGSTLVPLRFVSEELGANVEWDATTRNIVVMLDGKKMRLNANHDTVYVNDVKTTLPVRPEIMNGTTFVPLRFVSEQLGKKVEWNAPSKRITIK